MQLAKVLGVHLIVTIVLNGIKPIVSLHAYSIGASVAEIGILVSAYAFLPMLLAIKIGKVLDRIGAKKLTFYGAIGMMISLIVPMLIPTYFSLLFTQLVMGCSVICCIISMQKTVGNLDGNRDKLIALFTLMGSIGEFIGPLYTSFIYEIFGIRFTLGISIALLLVVLCIVLALPKSSSDIFEDSKPQSKGSTFTLLKNGNLRKALIISALVLSSKDLFVAYFPVYGTNAGLRPGTIGIILSVCAATAVLIRMFQFPLVHHYGRGKVLTVTLLTSAFSFFMIPLISEFYFLLVISALLGLGLGLGQPLSIVFAMNESETERHGEVLGLRLAINRISQFSAPFILGGISVALGVGFLFYLIGTTIFAGALFTRINEENKIDTESMKRIKHS